MLYLCDITSKSISRKYVRTYVYINTWPAHINFYVKDIGPLQFNVT